jgi:hypothetical protein
MSASYAVFFKTHYWDNFNERQLARLKARTGRGDVFILFDETFAPAPAISGERVIGITRDDLRNLDLAPVTTHGSIIWYNNDYPNYVAAMKLPEYDFYVSVEYDVVVNTSLDSLIDRLAEDRVDFLGFPQSIPVLEWPWYPLHADIYGPEMLLDLSCLAVFSAVGLAALLARRRADRLAFNAGTLTFWPHVEAFLPNEILRAGLHRASLAAYGATERYNWWPPLNEAHLVEAEDQAFIHPVLHGSRFVRSTIFHEPSFLNLCRANSPVRRRLREFGPDLVNPLIRAEFRRRVAAKAYEFAERLRLRPKWFARAKAGVAEGRQERQPHNAT